MQIAEYLSQMTKEGVRVDISKLYDVRDSIEIDGSITDSCRKRRIGLINSMISRVMLDGKVHPSWDEEGSVTGRITSSNPCLSNVPREARKAFVPAEGNVFIMLDYSAMEPRLTGYMSGCKALSDSDDVYEAIAKELSIDREQAKKAMISLPYGAGDLLLEEQTGVKNFRQKYDAAFSEVKVFQTAVMKEAYDKGVVTLYDGSSLPCRITEKDKRSYEFIHQCNRAVSMAVQGSAASIFKKAVNVIAEAGYDIRICLYDGLVVEVPSVYADQHVASLTVLMETIETARGMRFPVKVKIDSRWM